MKMNGAQIIIKSLERCGIKTVTGIPGGANLPLYDALHHSSLNHVLARHEQGAGFISHGMARSTGKAAVCFATSGPGVTNLITAIADAKLDSVPLVAITGQVPLGLIGTDAFQEVDTYGLTIPITKYNCLVRNTEELAIKIPEAIALAQSGRPGPVVIDVPKDIQSNTIELKNWPVLEIINEKETIDENKISFIADTINASKRPVLYIGGGIMSAGAEDILYRIAKKNSIPVTSTLMGLGCIAHNDPLNLGMLGMHGARYTNYILEEADCIIALGVRFDDRATGKVEEFCKNASIIHIDIDGSEIDKLKESNISMVGNCKPVLQLLEPMIESRKRAPWIQKIQIQKDIFSGHTLLARSFFDPIRIIKTLGEIADDDAIITTDVGQHQMWVAQAFPFNRPRTFLTSGGLGTMGFGLPAAIGAGLANPETQIICFAGDGSFYMNIQELATLAELNLNITVIIMNNGHLGLVRQQQELFYNKNYIASRFSINSDYAAIAQGFGIESYNLEGEGNPLEKIKNALRKPGPVLIDIPIHEAENVYPMVPPGAANREMIGGEKHEHYNN